MKKTCPYCRQVIPEEGAEEIDQHIKDEEERRKEVMQEEIKEKLEEEKERLASELAEEKARMAETLEQQKKKFEEKEERLAYELEEKEEKMRVEIERQAKAEWTEKTKETESLLTALKLELTGAKEKIKESEKSANELVKQRLAEQKQKIEEQTALRLEKEKEKAKKMEETLKTTLEKQKEAVQKEVEKALEKGRNENARETNQLRKKIEELQRKLERKPNEERGSANEEVIFDKLKATFKEGADDFKRVPKGKEGPDIVQTVLVNTGKECEKAGALVYEVKDVSRFNEKFVKKALDDKEREQANQALIVTTAFPGKERYYCLLKRGHEQVHVVHPDLLPYIAKMLRSSIVDLMKSKMSESDKELKLQLLYDYLRSEEFKSKIVRASTALEELKAILEEEQKEHQKKWEDQRLAQSKLSEMLVRVNQRINDLIESKPEVAQVIVRKRQKLKMASG